jgi:hypothetical protein
LDDVKADLGDTQLSVKLGLVAASLAIDTAMGECEFTAVDNVMDCLAGKFPTERFVNFPSADAGSNLKE